MANSWIFLAPSLILSAAAFALFGLDTLSGRNTAALKAVGFWLTLAGLALALGFTSHAGLDRPVVYGRGMLVSDGLSFVLTWIALITTFIVAVLSEYDKTFEDLP